MVPVSEASVIIAVSAEHRREAIEAVACAIDALKGTATIWKKVMYIIAIPATMCSTVYASVILRSA